MGMFNPPHPGETLREDVLPPLGLTVTEAARQLGVSRIALSRVLHGKAAISPDMAWKARLGPNRAGAALLRFDSRQRRRVTTPRHRVTVPSTSGAG